MMRPKEARPNDGRRARRGGRKLAAAEGRMGKVAGTAMAERDPLRARAIARSFMVAGRGGIGR